MLIKEMRSLALNVELTNASCRRSKPRTISRRHRKRRKRNSARTGRDPHKKRLEEDLRPSEAGDANGGNDFSTG